MTSSDSSITPTSHNPDEETSSRDDRTDDSREDAAAERGDADDRDGGSRPDTDATPGDAETGGEDEESSGEGRISRSEQVVELELKSTDDVTLAGNITGERLEDFASSEIHPQLLKAINQIGWTRPTPVQSLCLPYTLKGRDVAGFAQTGTGKTGVFLITTGQRLLQPTVAADSEDGPPGKQAQGARGDAAYPTAVVLVPTRELAVQIDQDAQGLFQILGIRSVAIFGGVDYDKQAKTLRDGVDVIVATPGRLKDFFQKKMISMAKCSIFVCDEADRMFDMGFIEDVEFFLDKLPERTQKLLFSATTNAEVKELAFEYLDTPAYISVNPETITPENIEQHTIICDAPNKLKVMLGLMRDHAPECAIIFVNTKLTAEWLHFKLVNNGIDADLITGDLPQKKRINLIQKIKEGKIKALIATDVASRGLHISRITHVYNFDLPDEPANYVHRIGRTARAGAKGSAYSLVCDDYGQNLAAIKGMLGEKISLDSRWFDERYLAIEDKAGNPFKDLKIRSPRAADGPRDGAGPRHDGPRNGGYRDRHDGPRGGRGGQGDRPRHDRGGQQARGGRGGEERDRGQQGGRGGQGRGERHGGRAGQHRDGSRDHHPRHGHRDGQGRGGQQHIRHDRGAAAHSAARTIQTPAAAPGLFGMMKKLFKSMFGKGG